MRGKRFRHFAAAIAAATLFVGLAGVGTAHADPTMTVNPSTGLTDNQQVTVTVSNLVTGPFASLELSLCGNAYANLDPLPAPLPAATQAVGSRDCEVLSFTTGGLSSSTVQFTPNLKQTGIGIGNRSCISAPPAAIPCYVYVSQSTNQTGPDPAVDISFAADPALTDPAPTITSLSINGSPIATSKPAVATIVVHKVGDGVVPEGTVDVELDGDVVETDIPMNGSGAATVPLAGAGSLASGTSHTVVARYTGNGSFEDSDSSTVNFNVVGDNNITAGSATVVEGDSGGQRKVVIPVILSKPSPVPVVVQYSASLGTAESDDFVLVSGKLRFNSLVPTAKYIVAKINPDTEADEGNETFFVNLSAPLGGLAGGYEFRDSAGEVTIIDDDETPIGPRIDVGDVSVPEGDTGGAKALKFAVTLSEPATTTFFATIVIGKITADKGTKTNGGDWGGGVYKKLKFAPGQYTKLVSVPTYTDIGDETDEGVSADVYLLCTDNTTNKLNCENAGHVYTGHTSIGSHAHGVGTILSDE